MAEFRPLGPREFEIAYEWEVGAAAEQDWRVFVHFGEGEKILFQDDHLPAPGTSTWQAGQRVRLGPHRVKIPESVQAKTVKAFVGLFGPGAGDRVRLAGGDALRRIQLGELAIGEELRFAPGGATVAPDRSCFTRCDQGWGEGQHPMDAFLRNTHEILGPLNKETFHRRLERFEFVTADRSVRRAVYGDVTVTANFGPAPATVASALGGEALLPQWGLLVESPDFLAFHAARWAGRDYPDGALFTVRAADGRPLAQARRLRVYHGFGDPRLNWGGRELAIPGEATIALD